MNNLRNGLLAPLLTEYPLVDPLVLFGFEMGLGNMKTIFWLAIQSAREPKAFMTALLENVCPFTGFEGNAVGAGKSRRNESDVFLHMA
jgi:hypothetical protein